MKEKIFAFILILFFFRALYEGRHIFQQANILVIFVLFIIIFSLPPYFIWRYLYRLQNIIIDYLNANFPDYAKKQHIEELKKAKSFFRNPKGYFHRTFFELPDLPKSDFIYTVMKKMVIFRLLSGLSMIVSACLFIFIVIFLQQSWDKSYLFSAILIGGGLPFTAAFIGYTVRLKKYKASLK